MHDHVEDRLRQFCAAHVFRDFEGFVTGAAGGRMFGRSGKAIVLRLFHAWWRFKGSLLRVTVLDEGSEFEGTVRPPTRAW